MNIRREFIIHSCANNYVFAAPLHHFSCRYGHIYKMAQSELKGINSVEGVEGILYQVPFLPQHRVGNVKHLHAFHYKLGPEISPQICHYIMLTSDRAEGLPGKIADERDFA